MRNQARFSGSWYPASPNALRQQLDSALSQVTRESEPVQAAVLPHAGLSFSARGMAPFFHAADQHAKRIVILAPSHYEYLPPNQLYGERFTAHQTPLGDLPGGEDLWASADATYISLFPEAIQKEHAVEMYLPYIAHTFGQSARVNAVLVPELTSIEEARTLANYLLGAISSVEDLSATLFIASSDFTHHGRRFAYTPFGNRTPEELQGLVKQLDYSVLEPAADLDLGRFFSTITDNPVTICGRFPVLILLAIAEQLSWSGRIVDYYNSNSLVGMDFDFVCYGTVLYEQ